MATIPEQKPLPNSSRPRFRRRKKDTGELAPLWMQTLGLGLGGS